jgi:hypothetical protein
VHYKEQTLHYSSLIYPIQYTTLRENFVQACSKILSKVEGLAIILKGDTLQEAVVLFANAEDEIILHLLFVIGPLAYSHQNKFGTVDLYRQSVGLLEWGIGLSQGRKDTTNTEETQTDMHASSGVRTHNPSVRSSEDSSCLRPRGHCDRLKTLYICKY